MSILETAIGAFLVLLPFVTSAIARSKGRSPLAWVLLSLVLTPFGSFLLLLILPGQDRGTADPNRRGGVLGTLPGAFISIALGDQAEAARNAKLDDRLGSEARDARVDQLIAQRLQALQAPPALINAPTAVTFSIKPTFGKRR